jgi:hypothetical protein
MAGIEAVKPPQAMNGTRAAHPANKLSTGPAAVKYARIVSGCFARAATAARPGLRNASGRL